ncbi:MAG TPA: DegT/DnrJ/EryC1/StrS family aminotransferase [Puia sp.]
MVNVTKAFLPDKEEFLKYIDGIWDRCHLTNHGPLVLELEARLKKYLGVKHFFFLNNGTIALQIAIKALDLRGKIITTPFSYVATTSSIVWENCTPVFADIKTDNLTIDPASIEKLITPDTTAIMATHVYGIPGDVNRIENIARKYGLRVIYDAAHAFGVEFDGRGLLNYGDISSLSFHATKLFHTIEGGGLATNDDELAHRINYMRNFGHDGPEKFHGVGINGKASEFNAAMGLTNLPHIEAIIADRKRTCDIYDRLIKAANLCIKRPTIPAGTVYNYAYYPTLFESEKALLTVKDALSKDEIFPRRYFYPSLNTLHYLTEKQGCPVSEDVSTRALCLPLYYGMEQELAEKIIAIIQKAL